MKVALHNFKNNTLHDFEGNDSVDKDKVGLVMAFGSRDIIEEGKCFPFLRNIYPKADVVLCTTSGEIYNNTVEDNTVSVSAIEFEKTKIKSVQVNIADYENSFDAGVALVNQFDFNELAHILIISDGSKVNGSELVRGIDKIVDNRVPVTGGLAGDADRFQKTYVGLNESPTIGKIVAIGFYGKYIITGHGSMGGWERFGPEKTVSKSKGNILYEIEGNHALEYYKMYLGAYAEKLPGSALLFPLSVVLPGEEKSVVRTILSIDETNNSMTFAGDIPEGSKVRFMKANFDKLIDAATVAANNAFTNKMSRTPKLSLLISCVGRKLILENRTHEEVEAVDETFHHKSFITGFYSYGEISPFTPGSKCELHNQTMTITTFDEI